MGPGVTIMSVRCG